MMLEESPQAMPIKNLPMHWGAILSEAMESRQLSMVR